MLVISSEKPIHTSFAYLLSDLFSACMFLRPLGPLASCLETASGVRGVRIGEEGRRGQRGRRGKPEDPFPSSSASRSTSPVDPVPPWTRSSSLGPLQAGGPGSHLCPRCLWPRGGSCCQVLLISGLPHPALWAFQLFLHFCHQFSLFSSICWNRGVGYLLYWPWICGSHRGSGVWGMPSPGEGDLGPGGAPPPACQGIRGKSLFLQTFSAEWNN